MARYFRVKNYDKFQHYSDRTPPWIKLYNCLLDDYDFTCLQDASKLHLILIWLLASRTSNRLPFDLEYLKQAIKTKTKPDLDELISYGFIEEIEQIQLHDDAASNALATCKQDACLEERRGEREKKRGEERTLRTSSPLTDEEFLKALKKNPAYEGLDIDRELSKLDAWLLTPRGHGKQKTRQRILNWLNGADRPMGGKHGEVRKSRNPTLEALEEYRRHRDGISSTKDPTATDIRQGDGDPWGCTAEHDSKSGEVSDNASTSIRS